jgi:hypothetical protein
MSDSTTWICCGVLRPEMESLHHDRKIQGRLVFLNSMLHMNPPVLEDRLSSALQAFRLSERVVVVYGDCCPRMRELVRIYSASRVKAINCAQMLLGRERYRQLMEEQAFLLLPEWTLRWNDVIQHELGLGEDVAGDFMQEFGHSLVYVDTGIVPVPYESLRRCAAYTKLPWQVERVTLDNLLVLLHEAEQSVPLPAI